MNRPGWVFALFLLLALSACSVEKLPFVYTPDVHQGMPLNQAMVDQLKAGMTRRQVSFILGSPAIVDTFHPERWEYVTAKKPGGGSFRSKRVTLYFDQDKLVRVRGDFQPADPQLRG